MIVRLRRGAPPEVQPRYPAFVLAAAVLIAVLPVVADGPSARPAISPAIALASAAPSAPASTAPVVPDSERVLLTGTLVCLQCETRHEAGLHSLPESEHEPGFCADNGEVWRLMPRDSSAAPTALGQTVTVEGVAFPHSGFLRASRVGY